jgi:hypothetical protein
MRSSGKPTVSWPDPRRRAVGVGAVVLAGLAGFAAIGTQPPPAAPRVPGPASRPELATECLYPVPFEPGETLEYSISWLQVEGGQMTLKTTRETAPDGVGLHRIVLSAQSNDLVSTFYRVRTRYETWVDVRDFQPVRFEKHAREGRYESDEVEEFDLSLRVASWRDERTPLPARIQDIISSFYWLRTQPLVPGQSVHVETFSRGKVYGLSAVVEGRERVETDAGAFDAFRIQPQLREDGSSEDRNRGRLFLWVSDDARRLPVMLRTILPIGAVTARLRKTTPLPAPPPAPG